LADFQIRGDRHVQVAGRHLALIPARGRVLLRAISRPGGGHADQPQDLHVDLR
jgi:hypothetical protein